MEEVIEGKRIPIYSWSWKNQRVKCWYFYVYKAIPSPSGMEIRVVHRTKTRTLYYWTIQYSGIEGDAKNAGVPYGIRVIRKPFKKKLPKYIRSLIWKLLKLKRHEIKTPNQGDCHDYEKGTNAAQEVLRRLGIIDPRGMCVATPIRKRPKKGSREAVKSND